MQDCDNTEKRLGERLASLGKTLALAESCTGGLIAHRVTNVPGSSAFFLGGVVAYSNEAKMKLLGVEESALAEWGAVSEAVACQMAAGACRRFGADLAAGVTGIAGPTGGTPEKPVGLVYVAVAWEGEAAATRFEFEGTRLVIKEQTAEQALRLLWERLA